MKILLFANTDWYLYNFRLALARRLKDEGREVVLASPPGDYGPRLVEMGFRWIPVNFPNSNTKPLSEVALLIRVIELYQAERFDLCHHFTIKCVLYGSIAARIAGVPAIVNAVTGMGHIFTDSGLKALLLRPLVKALYRFALGRKRSRVIFQNDEDRGYFIANKLVGEESTSLIRGSGVNCRVYRPSLQKSSEDPQLPVRVLFASRLLWEKGISELLSAVRMLRTAGERTEFIFAGNIYPGNPSSLSVEDLASIRAEGLVDYRGHVDDMVPLLAESDIVVLPSYREGTPRILIEAAAMAKPIVATDIAGCRGLVQHGINGLVVPIKTVKPLVEALTTLIRNPELRRAMGAKGPQIVLEEFDEEIVIRKTLELYQVLWEK